MQRSAIIIFSFFIGIMAFSLQGNAVLYPTNTPDFETPGGTFQTYFDNMYATTQCNVSLQVVAGFAPDGTPICVTPTAVGFSLPGQTFGDTIRYDGANWIRTNFLYNSGSSIGIGTQSPTATLDVNGQIRIRGGVPGIGKLLMSDATGIASWYDPLPSLSGSFWAVGGNTFSAMQNLGTISNHSLPIITNNIERMRIDTAGNVGIGVTNPTARLEVGGQIKINGGGVGSGKFLVSDASGLASWTDVVAATSFSISGSTLGDTLYYNGSDWVRTNNIFHTGGNVGIGTTSPGAKLEIAGQIRITGGTPAAGLFLMSDATGLATWSMPVISGIAGGQPNYIARWLTSTTLGTGTIYDNGTQVGFGKTNPTRIIDTAGDIVVNSLFIGRGGGNFEENTVLGWNAFTSNTSGQYNTAIGQYALANNTTGFWNAAIGSATLSSNTTGSRNTAVGQNALNENIDGGLNTAVGDRALQRNLSGSFNTAIGGTALNSNISGSENVAVGNGALEANTIAWANTAVGTQSLGSNITGNYNTAVGTAVLYSNISGNSNTAQGNWALYYNTTGGSNTAIGQQALRYNTTGSSNVAMGVHSLEDNTTGESNVSIGNEVLANVATGSYNTAIGINAANLLTLGNNNIAIGYDANLQSSTGSNQLSIGNWIYGSGGNIGIGTGSSLIAKLTVAGQIKITGGTPGSGKILTSDATGLAVWSDGFSGTTDASGIVGGTGSENYLSKFGTGGIGLLVSQIYDDGINVGIGTNTPTGKFEVWDGAMSIFHSRGLANFGVGAYASNHLGTGGNNLGIGNYSLYSRTTAWNNLAYGGQALYATTTGNANQAFGELALRNNISGSNNIANGYGALYSNTTADDNVAIGVSSLYSNTTGGYNTAVGSWTLYSNISGNSNTSNGHGTLFSNTTGSDNVANGVSALYDNTTGGQNTAVGSQSLRRNGTGSGNTAIGNSALNNATGSQNTALGRNAASLLTFGDYNIAIGSNAQLMSSTGSNQLNIGNWIYGTGGNIGIGVANATAKLEVAGQLKITGGSPGSGKILTSDATGLAVWSTGFSGSVTASGITGGTQNYVTKFGTGGNGLVISQIYDTGTGVGIGTTNIGSKFEVWTGAVTLMHFRGTSNLGIGSSSVRYQTSGTANVGVGHNTLRTLTTGYSNAAFGDSAGYNTTTGFFNSSLGAQALYSNSIGNWNVAIGTQALWTNLDGNYNVALGGQALYANSTNSNNVAIGYQALRAALSNNNTAVGYNAGSGITTGANNIIIGANIAPQLGNTTSDQLNIGNWIYGNNGRISIGKSTMGSGAYRLDVAGGFVNSASGYCINNSCIPNWSGIFDAINGSGNYLPKWNASGTGLIASRLSDNGVDLSISSGALQQIIITPANQDQYQQVIISTGGVLKKGLTTREKLRIFAVSDYGVNNDSVAIQNLCFDTSTNAACRTSAADNPLSNVPNFNSVDAKSYTGGIGEYFPATATRPAMFVSYYTGTYMVVNSYTFHNTSFSTSDLGCNVFPYYSLYTNSGSIPNLAKYDVSAPVTFTIKNDTAISNVYSSTNLSLPTQKTTRVGSQFISNVFMTPGQALLMTIGVQSCASRADRSMSLVTNDQRKMTLSITEL